MLAAMKHRATLLPGQVLFIFGFATVPSVSLLPKLCYVLPMFRCARTAIQEFLSSVCYLGSRTAIS